jgi:TonB family protein
VSAPRRTGSRFLRRPAGFWARPEVRRYLPAAIGLLAMVLLALTFAVAPGRTRRDAGLATRLDAAQPGSVSEERADLRRAPDSRSETMITLARGAPVTIVEEKGTWCRVRDGSGRQGYLPRHAVEREADRALRARRAETILKFQPLSADIAEDSPLLLAPFSFAAVWGQAERGASVDVYSVDHGYYALRLPDGTLGFIASEDVDIVPANPAEPALTPGSGRVVKGISVSEQNPAPPAAADESPVPGAVPGPPAMEVPLAGITGEPPAVPETAPAVLLEKIEPVYPAAALSARVAGTVVLQVTIDREGNVTRVDVKRPAPLGMTEAAIAAVERWKYRPATGPGGPIPSMKLVRIEFKPPGD